VTWLCATKIVAYCSNWNAAKRAGRDESLSMISLTARTDSCPMGSPDYCGRIGA
jgi:hypothetical protein